MLAKRIIPCLDVKDGRVVKGVNFVGLRDAGDPVEVARRYDEQGADEITFLDITASSDNRATRLYVAPATGGWVVRREGAERATSVHETQAEAVKAARAALHRSGGEVRVQGRNGQILESRTLGREPMARIAAVEGIALSPRMKKALADLDRRGASPEEQRRVVAEQFGKKR